MDRNNTNAEFTQQIRNNKKHLRYSLFTLIVLTFYYTQGFAIATLVLDPSNLAQTTISAENSVRALYNQAKQLEYDLQNLKRLSGSNFQSTQSVLNQLSDLTGDGKALSYGLKNVTRQYKETFSGLHTSQDYHLDYTRWSGTTYDTLKSSMGALAFQGKLFESENKHLNELASSSNNIEGNLSAQQLSHQIALEQIGQVQKLRQLMLTQASTQTTWMAYQLQKEQSEEAALHDWITHNQLPFKPYNQEGKGFGVDSVPKLP